MCPTDRRVYSLIHRIDLCPTRLGFFFRCAPSIELPFQLSPAPAATTTTSSTKKVLNNSSESINVVAVSFTLSPMAAHQAVELLAQPIPIATLFQVFSLLFQKGKWSSQLGNMQMSIKVTVTLSRLNVGEIDVQVSELNQRNSPRLFFFFFFSLPLIDQTHLIHRAHTHHHPGTRVKE